MKRLLLILSLFCCWVASAANVTNVIAGQQLWYGEQLTTVAGAGGGLTNVTGGLVYWAKFDDASGTNATDSSSGMDTGFFSGTPVWTNGVINGALYFTNNAGISLTNIHLATSYSLTFWVWPGGWLSGNKALIATNTDNGLFISAPGTSSHNCALELWINAGGHNDTETIPTNSWTHVALVVTNGGATFYTNGVCDGYSQTMNFFDFKWIAKEENATEWFTGRIDDVRAYNRALSTNEISQVYQWRGEP